MVNIYWELCVQRGAMDFINLVYTLSQSCEVGGHGQTPILQVRKQASRRCSLD